MIKFASYINVNPTVEPASNVLGFELKKIIRQPEEVPDVEEDALVEAVPEIVIPSAARRPSIDTSDLLSIDIEDIFRQAGLTTVNGKLIKFGNKALRAQNASFGAKNSNHKKRDPHTGNAMARDISIIGGNLDDYTEFRRQIMSNDLISKYMDTKGWGIINEVTPQILARTGGTGLHFHFGPDTWARRTWNSWKDNPDAPITQAFGEGGMIRKFLNSGKVEPSFWDKLDNWVATAEIPMAVGATAATLATASSGGAAAPALVLNLGSAGIDAYLALRNLYKGNYALAGLDGVELLAGLIGAKYAKAAKAVPSKAVKILQAANKGSNSLEREYLRLRAKVRLRRASSKGMSVKEAAALRGAAFGTYGIVSAGTRNLIDAVPVDKTRVAQHRIYKKGGAAPDSTKGRFTFKKSLMVKDAEKLNGKRDMKKKLVKSDVVTNKKKRILKGLSGLKFATYTPVETPIYKPDDINPFSDYNFPSTYKEYALTEPVQIDLVSQTDQLEQLDEAPKQSLKTQTSRIVDHIYKDRNKWVKDLKDAYRKAGITNENALKMLIAQDALESGWGKSALGKFNYGNLTPGKSWKGEIVNGRDHDSKGNPISLKFRSYSSMEEYAADKVQFLKTLYDFNENDDISTFTHKLQGGNKGKRKYAAGSNYIQLVTKIYNTSKL